MKKLFKVAVIAISVLFASNFAHAQTKIGYLNFQMLGSQMPEAKTIKLQVDEYSKQFIDQLTTMNNELRTKGQAYQTQSTTMTDAIRATKESELQDLQKRIQDYNTKAQQQVENRSNELTKPLSDKLRAAVAQVAKDKGYAYVLDTSQGSPLIISPDSDDLTVAVKAQLGIK